MNKDVISYKRNLSGSFLILSEEGSISEFDEGLLLRNREKGLLPMQRCSVDGSVQYWYNITGRQSLENLLGLQNMGRKRMEQVIRNLCDRVNWMERHLIDQDCLRLEAETIFLDYASGEFCFLACPRGRLPLSESFRGLMEYLLTRIDHKDELLVKMAYGLYEKSLEEGFVIPDLREMITEEKEAEEITLMEEIHPSAEVVEENAPEAEAFHGDPTEDNRRDWPLTAALRKLLGKFRKRLADHRVQQPEEALFFTYDEEAAASEETKEPLHQPTVLLTAAAAGPEGLLIYEGSENFTSLRLREGLQKLGSGIDADLQIPKESVSHYHAAIEGKGEAYYIEDLNSTNGTFLNGEPLAYKEKRLLKRNDLVRFGDVRYRFV